MLRFPQWSGLLLVAMLGLGACASKVPMEIREPVPGSPELRKVLADPAAFVGSRVRWGGAIAQVENEPETTRLQVVGRQLGSEGRPQGTDRSPGRFLVEVAGFLDPAIFVPGRKITVTGVLLEPVERPIGDFSYEFPVVRARVHYLWPRAERTRREYYPPPWYYDPWYPYHLPYHRYW